MGCLRQSTKAFSEVIKEPTKMGICIICGAFTKVGQLCSGHAKAYYDYAEEGKYCEDEEFINKHKD